MKKLNNQFFLVSFLLLMGTFVSAQNKTLLTYKNNNITNAIEVSQIDSIKFRTSIASQNKTLLTYKNDYVTNAIDMLQIDSLKFSNVYPAWADNPALKTLKAFPGAEGFGANVTGGRGGRVLYVTRLEDDSNTGSLRWAINQSGARIIMFKVAGRIQLKSRLAIKNGNVTIAGHTAPGDGICISEHEFTVEADNVIIRYMRFRLGWDPARGGDAIGGRNRKNIILDHCSISWGMDETASFYDNENFTMQWCLISEGVLTRRYLGLWGGRKASFHHNLLAHFSGRFPRFNGARYSNRPNEELVDFRNNVSYNWGNHNGAGGEGGCYNIVNNYYQPGPESRRPNFILQASPSGGGSGVILPNDVWGSFHIVGNLMMKPDGTPSETFNNDNWTAVDTDPGNRPNKPVSALKSDVEFDKGDITTHTAQDAYELVLTYAGASLRRDSIDTRIVNEVANRLAPDYKHLAHSNGERTNTLAGLINRHTDVGGWKTYTDRGEVTPDDADGDGIPDEWETANGLDPNDSTDGAKKTLTGDTYTNLEVYLYDLLRGI